MQQNAFALTILKWFRENGRELPWRQTRDPYAIWLSEIILQQTRTEQGRPYWERFMRRWPTVEALAAATEDEVLREWQGLGYYSRARNLHSRAWATTRQPLSAPSPSGFLPLWSMVTSIASSVAISVSARPSTPPRASMSSRRWHKACCLLALPQRILLSLASYLLPLIIIRPSWTSAPPSAPLPLLVARPVP